ncbi:putative microtubule-associated protein, MAP65/Ase1/PRC1 [Lupinus albus]|uniref:Putative microtubule-associated protein, MAP65/Ase1/PRC1 n=1 Tax=Lupinus albus TaxID=3870 RepID=A0A6A4NBX1_LUPAL|nr:putative microtubule-associated protein, MAP65/Ase1/PRC1 [Lupinus albus]
MALIDSGNIEPTELLADMDNQIENAKEEALSRKDILDKLKNGCQHVKKRVGLKTIIGLDENRYNASRGAHLNLKRAEKARILVNKIPALVDTLVAKTRAWEEDHGMSFTYDGVPLLAMLDEYAMLRHEREEEKRRMRDQKKYNELQNTEQEPVFGSRPSSARPVSAKKLASPRTNGGTNGTPNRRLSINAHQNGSKSTLKEGKRKMLEQLLL